MQRKKFLNIFTFAFGTLQAYMMQVEVFKKIKQPSAN